jgi:hypothetical protein
VAGLAAVFLALVIGIGSLGAGTFFTAGSVCFGAGLDMG